MFLSELWTLHIMATHRTPRCLPPPLSHFVNKYLNRPFAPQLPVPTARWRPSTLASYRAYPVVVARRLSIAYLYKMCELLKLNANWVNYHAKHQLRPVILCKICCKVFCILGKNVTHCSFFENFCLSLKRTCPSAIAVYSCGPSSSVRRRGQARQRRRERRYHIQDQIKSRAASRPCRNRTH